MNNYNKNFCILPFTHVSTRPGGEVLPCCRYLGEVGNIRSNTLEEIWNGTQMTVLRTSMLADKRTAGCTLCWEVEDSGGMSMRQSMNDIREYDIKPAVAMDFKIPVIELKLSNLCNLRCRMCKPDLSTSWLKDWKVVSEFYAANGGYSDTGRHNHFDNASFIADFEKLIPYFDVIEFAGGEPLMDPLHYKLLQLLIDGNFAKHIRLKYSTNMSKLSFGKWEVMPMWHKFKQIDISVSIDGHPTINNYIRSDVNTTRVAANIAEVQATLGDKFIGRAALCASAFNAYQLPESFEYFTKELNLMCHSNFVSDPPFLSLQILPLELKHKIIEKYNSCSIAVDSWKISAMQKKQINKFLKNNEKYMMAKDDSALWPKFIEYSALLDVSRETDLLSIFPEFKDYV